MTAAPIFITDFTDSRFCTAFQAYFAELGVSVRDWDGLFREMSEGGTNRAYLLLDDTGKTLGFLQFQLTNFSNWFFEEPFGFVREFWIAPVCRRQGYGSLLLELSERYFAEHGAYRSLLTADGAVDFYLSKGYQKFPGITARNKMEVFVKTLY